MRSEGGGNAGNSAPHLLKLNRALKIMEKKKRDYEIRQQRIANGMCSTLDCDAQAGINKTNKQVSRYCDPCKARIQERKKVSDTSTAHLLEGGRYKPKYDFGKTNGDLYGIDAPDYRDQLLPKAILDIGVFIDKAKHATVGAIRRAFPEYERILWDTLKLLKLDGVCNYNEFSPAPTRVFVGSMKRIDPKHWNNSALYAKTGEDSRAVPDSDSFADPRRRVTA